MGDSIPDGTEFVDEGRQSPTLSLSSGSSEVAASDHTTVESWLDARIAAVGAECAEVTAGSRAAYLAWLHSTAGAKRRRIAVWQDHAGSYAKMLVQPCTPASLEARQNKLINHLHKRPSVAELQHLAASQKALEALLGHDAPVAEPLPVPPQQKGEVETVPLIDDDDDELPVPLPSPSIQLDDDD
mmetsp:Transcript_94580/g.216359  ORF Transcript_94580/g.216359 Transcript_94580/m.216359 type:complete len:185 (-) Transcript_94580:354-908(-)